MRRTTKTGLAVPVLALALAVGSGGCAGSSGPGGGVTDEGTQDLGQDRVDLARPPDAAEHVELRVEDALPEVDAGDAGAPDGNERAVPDQAEAAGCLPGDGCFLDPCAENTDCASGWCVDHLGEGVCTIECVEECPAGFACGKLAASAPDVVYACLSPWPRLCLPCLASPDCKTAENLSGMCVTSEPAEGYFCGAFCNTSQDCPAGYSCGQVTTVEGMTTMQCVPDSGLCQCTQKATARGLNTACEQTNEWGTCTGFRECAAGGLTPCDALLPAAETCDGTDNDCDGSTDEDTCDDENPCTSDACQGAAGCQHTPVANQECTDGDLCTTGDHCQDGLCAGSPVVCQDGNPCTDDFCGPDGSCASAANHELCDDGNPCTLGDVCDQEVCAGTPISCDCQKDADCAALEDGNLCNGTLFCNKAGLPYKCEVKAGTTAECLLPADADPFCQKAQCLPETGECVTVAANEGFACSDGSACTVGEKCITGQCAGATPFPCDDKNACTQDACVPASGCTFIKVAGPCDDGNPCTIGDKCDAGVCVSGTLLACDDGNPCTTDLCDPASGCKHEAALGLCDDGNPCTANDKCQGGMCLPGGATSCEDGNPCTTDTCDPTSGCVHTLNNLPCNDGNVCTKTDTCQQGLCVGTGLMSCNDGNACTDDSCDPAQGCQFKHNNVGCDDGNACTLSDQCKDGTCSSGAVLNCNDGNACTDDSCSPVSGCLHTPSQAACSDSDPCTKNDQCGAGVCAGQPYSCNDGLACTQDVCDGKGGCYHPVTPGLCYINGECRDPAETDPGNSCLACMPAASQDAWSPLTGPKCADIDHGTAACDKGTCKVTACQPGWGDCDLALATGCEADLKADEHCGNCQTSCAAPEHCYDGKCSFQCPPGLTNCDGKCLDTSKDAEHCGNCTTVCKASGPAKLGSCAGGKCSESPCPQDTWNIDLAPGNGCEYECALTNNGQEACDTFDNDCDKQVDEGFDLNTDVKNCGSCGKACGPYPHVAAVACAAGKCAISQCAEGYKDGNGNALDGCEEMIATGQIWVDAWNFFDPDEDGTQAHPFDTIPEGLNAAQDGTLIHILEGTYAGGVTVTKANVVLEGQGKDKAFILGPAYKTGVLIKAAGVQLQSLTVQGAAVGIQFEGVSSGKVKNVNVTAITGNTDQEGLGIRLVNCGPIVIESVEVNGVTGGSGSTGCSASAGQIGAGISIEGTQTAKVLSCTIHAITGGSGGNSQCGCYSAGNGALAAGILLRSNSTNNEVTGNVIYNVKGGNGGAHACGGYASGATAGGIAQLTGAGLSLNQTVVYDIRGGLAGGAASGYSACLYGSGVGAMLVSNVTCVGSKTARQRGIWADTSPQGLFGVASTIVAHMTDVCLYSAGGNFPSTLMVSYSDIFDCAGGATSNAQMAGSCITVDPLFKNEQTFDYKLQATSPCINTGKPTADYCNEPQPNGCVVDMGAYGNTPSATPKAGANHCACQ